MAQIIQAVRGMNDILPPVTFLWQRAENIMRRVMQSYGFQEIRTPMLEKTELFKRSIGEVTDIVEKEMYTFLDRNDESLTLRPEGTACIVRAGVEHGLLYNQIQRLWYQGPFFRYERPQKGRYRQFYQCAAEIFGLEGPDIDAELILMSALILERLELKKLVKLEINSLGSASARESYRKKLIEYFEKNKQHLDEDSLRRLHKNPLRILDSKNPQLKPIIKEAPKLLDHLDSESKLHFEKLQDYLRAAQVKFEVNPSLVRGLDYYTKTVFEWTTDALGAQGTVCAGGRYDSLVGQLGGKNTPALGFAIGMERVILLMEALKIEPPEKTLHGYIVTDGEEAFKSGLKLGDYLRTKAHGIRIVLHCGGGSLKSQLKKADKSAALYAIILGEHELQTKSVTLKNLREDIPQQNMYQDELAEYLKLKIAKA